VTRNYKSFILWDNKQLTLDIFNWIYKLYNINLINTMTRMTILMAQFTLNSARKLQAINVVVVFSDVIVR